MAQIYLGWRKCRLLFGSLAFPEQRGLFQGPRLGTGIITFQSAEESKTAGSWRRYL
jgi:hypothetical protein